MISQWRLPPELGGGVVNPTEALSATMRRVKVPGTEWTVFVPAECLVPILPEEPPVNSVVLALKGATEWSIFQRRDDNLAAGWVRPGPATVSNWQGMHEKYGKIHVLLWWDKEKAEEGVVASAVRSLGGLVVSDVEDDDPGLAMTQLTSSSQKAYLDRDEAMRAAAALIGLAMKELM